MNYALSQHINPDKVFLVKRSELEGRMDSTYISKKINSNRRYCYPTMKLGKLTKSLTGGTPSKDHLE